MAKSTLPELKPPKVYDRLKALRKRTDLKLKANPYIQEWVNFRYYQVVGILHMILMSRMVLGDGTGLGKTVEMIGAYAHMLAKDPTLKMLIIAPKSATAQWVDEFNRFTQGIDARRLENFGPTSRKKQYREFWEDPTRNVFVMHYHFFREDIRLYEPHMRGKNFILVLDEATAVKSHTSKTHKVAQQVQGMAARVYGLTATLLKNNLIEGFGIYKVVLPPLFKNITSFKRWFCVEKKIQANGRKIPIVVGYKNVGHFRAMIDPYFLGRNKYDVSDELPELVTKEIRCGLTPLQLDLYAQALDGMLEVGGAEGFEEKETTQLTQIGYCQQIVNSPELIGHEGPSDKERELLRLMDEELAGEKVIIFSKYKKMINRIEKLFAQEGIKTTRITGDESEDQRTINKLMFQEDMPAIKRWVVGSLGDGADPRTKRRVMSSCKTQLRKLKERDFPTVMLLTPAGTEAINLQKASAFVFYDAPWSPGDYDQLLGRMIRIGSEHETVVAIHLMCRGTVDDHVMAKLKDKSRVIKKVLGEQTKGALVFDTMNDVKDLFNRLKADALRLKAGGKKALADMKA